MTRGHAVHEDITDRPTERHRERLRRIFRRETDEEFHQVVRLVCGFSRRIQLVRGQARYEKAASRKIAKRRGKLRRISFEEFTDRIFGVSPCLLRAGRLVAEGLDLEKLIDRILNALFRPRGLRL